MSRVIWMLRTIWDAVQRHDTAVSVMLSTAHLILALVHLRASSFPDYERPQLGLECHPDVTAPGFSLSARH